jgi:hypothetical protein
MMPLFAKNPHCNFYLFLRRVDQSPIIICVALGSCSILTTGRGEGRGEGGRGGGGTMSVPGLIHDALVY